MHVIAGQNYRYTIRPREGGVSQWHGQTDRQTDRHRNSMTESAQWADSGKNPA